MPVPTSLSRRNRRATISSTMRSAQPRPEALEERVLLSAYYVSPGGSDAGPGTSSAPFRTIQEAANVAQPGDAVLIHAGIYHETVRPPRSGARRRPDHVRARRRRARHTWTGPTPSAGGPTSAAPSTRPRSPGTWARATTRSSWTAPPRPRPAGRTSAPTPPGRPPRRWAPSPSPPAPAPRCRSRRCPTPAFNFPAGAWDGATIHFNPGQQWAAQTGTVIRSGPGTLTFSFLRAPTAASTPPPGPAAPTSSPAPPPG